MSQIEKMQELERQISRIGDVNPQSAAEQSFVLSVLYKELGDYEGSAKFKRKTIAFLKQRQTEELSRNTTILGIKIPDKLTEETVKAFL